MSSRPPIVARRGAPRRATQATVNAAGTINITNAASSHCSIAYVFGWAAFQATRSLNVPVLSGMIA